LFFKFKPELHQKEKKEKISPYLKNNQRKKGWRDDSSSSALA
jgi:hypothetical protein